MSLWLKMQDKPEESNIILRKNPAPQIPILDRGRAIALVPAYLEARRPPKQQAFFINPTGKLLHLWNGFVSCIFTYNVITIAFRRGFSEINDDNKFYWFAADYSADFVYIMDIFCGFHMGFFDDEGVLQTQFRRTRLYYMNSSKFYFDLLSLLPLDLLWLSINFNSAVRCFRLVKIYKFWNFHDRAERHTNYPNLIRALKLLYYLLIFIHLNACLYNWIIVCVSESQKSISDNIQSSNLSMSISYIMAVKWSLKTLTLMQTDLKITPNDSQLLHIFSIFELFLSLLLFATVLGYVNNIVTNISAGRKEFQSRLDNVKNFLAMRGVPKPLQTKVINWFDYLWFSNNISDESTIVDILPDKLKIEIAIHVHLNTLKRVEIFQNTEEGFLSELVVRLRSQIYSPGDYICRKGEIGKQMYIVSRGKLNVLADDDCTVLATLKPGGYFGEISILNLGDLGNRRTASVQSVGYSDLYCLSKSDLWNVLKDYPNVRSKLEAVAVKRLKLMKESKLKRTDTSAAVSNTNEHKPSDPDEENSSPSCVSTRTSEERQSGKCRPQIDLIANSNNPEITSIFSAPHTTSPLRRHSFLNTLDTNGKPRKGINKSAGSRKGSLNRNWSQTEKNFMHSYCDINKQDQRRIPSRCASVHRCLVVDNCCNYCSPPDSLNSANMLSCVHSMNNICNRTTVSPLPMTGVQRNAAYEGSVDTLDLPTFNFNCNGCTVVKRVSNGNAGGAIPMIRFERVATPHQEFFDRDDNTSSSNLRLKVPISPSNVSQTVTASTSLNEFLSMSRNPTRSPTPAGSQDINIALVRELQDVKEKIALLMAENTEMNKKLKRNLLVDEKANATESGLMDFELPTIRSVSTEDDRIQELEQDDEDPEIVRIMSASDSATGSLVNAPSVMI